jgi:hypothetical protein
MQGLKQDLETGDICHPLTNHDFFIGLNVSAINLTIIRVFIEHGNKLVTRLSVWYVSAGVKFP